MLSDDESFRVVAVDATNVHHVGTVIRSVYGEEFPVVDVYQPETLWKEVEAGHLVSGLFFHGDALAGYISMFKTAPNPRLWEAGSMVIVPEYARADTSLRLADCCMEFIKHQVIDMDGFFVEPVCSHYFIQFGAAKKGMIDCCLELDQLDGGSFKDGKSNRAGVARISCLLSFMEMADPKGPLYVPARYDGILRKIAASLRPRVFIPSTATLPSRGATRLEGKYYPSPRTWKMVAPAIGSDWAAVVKDIVNQGRKREAICLQITLDMALPHVGAAADILCEQGFFFSGMAPRWFGSDGLIMQRLFGSKTDYEEMKLYTPIAKELLKFIRVDREAVGEASVLPDSES